MRSKTTDKKSQQNQKINNQKSRSLFFPFFDIPYEENWDFDESEWNSHFPSSTPAPTEFDESKKSSLPDFNNCVGMVVDKCIEYIKESWKLPEPLKIELATMYTPLTRDWNLNRVRIYINGTEVENPNNQTQIVIKRPGIG